MAANIVPELVDLIIGALHTEDPVGKHTIAQCGLVCKKWLPSSRRHLFSEVTLNDRTITTFLNLVEASPFPIPSFIRSLALHSSEGEQALENGLAKLGPLPQVTTLRIRMDRTVFTRNSALLASSFPNVSALCFHGSKLRLRSILDAVSSFSALQNLQLDSIELMYDNSTSPLPLPPHWHSLTLSLGERQIGRFFQAILSLNTIPIFTSLCIQGEEDPAGSSFFDKYLRRVGKDLVHLRLESDGYIFPGKPQFLLYPFLRS
jgi:hypothetical protein